MTEKTKESADEYVKALEEELLASLEREQRLSEEELSVGAFMVGKVRKSKFYKKIISDPDSGIGKMARAPRSIYRLVRNPEVRKGLMQKKTVNGEKVEEVDVTHFLDPWMVELKKRKGIAERALKDGKKLALYFVEKPDSSTFRYRCYNTFEITRESTKWQAVYFFKNELDSIVELLPRCSELVFGRQSGQEKTIEKLSRMAHDNGIRVGLDIDDLVFDVKYLDIMLNTIGEKTNRSYWVAYFASVQAMAKQMDFFVTTNEFLAEKVKRSFNKPVKVIRNSLNQGQINASSVYVMQKKLRHEKGFIIGYFSGSPTHAKDFAVVEPELIGFLKRHDDAILNVVGYMKFSKEAERLVDNGRIRFLPFTDFRKLQRLMAEVDVNIAPLVINDFTNCKSELKFFEAAVVETTTIASPTYCFKKAIIDGKNGFLAESGEWHDKLEHLYNNPEENRRIALAAKKYALKHYYGKEFLKEVEETYDYFAK